MSKIKKVFLDADDDTEIEIFCTGNNQILINLEDGQGTHTIILDISTAIAFSKELRSQINLAKEYGER